MQAAQAFGLSRPELKLLLWIPIPVIIALALSGPTNLLEGLGLKGSPAASTLPAVAGFVVAFGIFGAYGFEPRIPSHETVFGRVIVAGLSEEVLFRGFALTQLIRAGFGIPGAIGVTSLLFGLAHAPVVWNSGNPIDLFLEVAITGTGGLVLALMMLLMNGSVFVAMAMHMAINLVWEIFAVAPNAIGGIEGIVARIAAAIAGLLLAYLLGGAQRAREMAT
jgi:membrane protease YdiL (CAAX protease family)